MEFESISADQLRTNDLFVDPKTNSLYECRGKRKNSQKIYIRDFLSKKITETHFSHTVLRLNTKIDSFPKYQVLEFLTGAISLFDSDSGNIFELSSVHLGDDVKKSLEAYNNGKEVNAEVFEYEEDKTVFRLIFEGGSEIDQPIKGQQSTSAEAPDVSNEIPDHIKEIEARKAKRRAFTTESTPAVKPKISPKKTKTKATSKPKKEKLTKVIAKTPATKKAKVPAKKKKAKKPASKKSKAPAKKKKAKKI